MRAANSTATATANPIHVTAAVATAIPTSHAEVYPRYTATQPIVMESRVANKGNKIVDDQGNEVDATKKQTQTAATQNTSSNRSSPPNDSFFFCCCATPQGDVYWAAGDSNMAVAGVVSADSSTNNGCSIIDVCCCPGRMIVSGLTGCGNLLGECCKACDGKCLLVCIKLCCAAMCQG
jgi:hypothetical protein